MYMHSLASLPWHLCSSPYLWSLTITHVTCATFNLAKHRLTHGFNQVPIRSLANLPTLSVCGFRLSLMSLLQTLAINLWVSLDQLGLWSLSLMLSINSFISTLPYRNRCHRVPDPAKNDIRRRNSSHCLGIILRKTQLRY